MVGRRLSGSDLTGTQGGSYVGFGVMLVADLETSGAGQDRISEFAPSQCRVQRYSFVSANTRA
jgi:hypothetical protein